VKFYNLCIYNKHLKIIKVYIKIIINNNNNYNINKKNQHFCTQLVMKTHRFRYNRFITNRCKCIKCFFTSTEFQYIYFRKFLLLLNVTKYYEHTYINHMRRCGNEYNVLINQNELYIIHRYIL